MNKPVVGLAELSDAIRAAGERGRKERAAADKLRAKQVKQCPCHGKVCQEVGMGMKVCPPGVCVRMN